MQDLCACVQLCLCAEVQNCFYSGTLVDWLIGKLVYLAMLLTNVEKEPIFSKCSKITFPQCAAKCENLPAYQYINLPAGKRKQSVGLGHAVACPYKILSFRACWKMEYSL